MNSDKIICQKCGASGSVEIIPKLSHHNIIALIAGGIVLTLLWAVSRKTDFKCNACQARFAQRTTKGWVCLVALWVSIIIIAIGLWSFEPQNK